MKKSKALLAAVSVVAIAGMTTACSEHRANTLSTPDVVAQESGQEDSKKQALLDKLEMQNLIGSNLEALAQSGYDNDSCSSDTLSSMTEEGNQVSRILNSETGSRGIILATNQLLKKSGNRYCQVSALADVAKKTLAKYVYNVGDDQAGEFDSAMDQAAIISGIIGPRLKKIKDQITAAEKAKADFDAKADRHGNLEAKIDMNITTINQLIETLASNCAGPNCNEVAIATSSNEKVQKISTDLDQYGISAGDDKIDSKIAVLENKYASLVTIRTQISNLVGASTPSEEVGINAKNGAAGFGAQEAGPNAKNGSAGFNEKSASQKHFEKNAVPEKQTKTMDQAKQEATSSTKTSYPDQAPVGGAKVETKANSNNPHTK